MTHIVLQMGHVARTRGATGTDGEQHQARRVCAEAAVRFRLLGHRCDVIGADDPIRRSDVFIAVHFDGSVSESARGASWGYRGDIGSRDVGMLWQRTYAAAGQQFWRPINYTSALAGYYGTGRARAAGTLAAIIVEGEFLTNPTARGWVESQAGMSALAQALVAAGTGRAAAAVRPLWDVDRIAARVSNALRGADAHGQDVVGRLHDADVQSQQAFHELRAARSDVRALKTLIAGVSS